MGGRTRVAPFFDDLAGDYDRWFESPRGIRLFPLEVECIRRVLAVPASAGGPRLEVGVGTGRFAAALDFRHGIDVSLPMLRMARARGVAACRADAAALPFPAGAFSEVLLVVTICFLDRPEAALGECARVLAPGGGLVVGLVPAGGAWGRLYAEKARAGHRYYRRARFYTCARVTAMAREHGFTFSGGCSTLLHDPGIPPDGRVREGVDETAGFVAMRFRRGLRGE